MVTTGLSQQQIPNFALVRSCSLCLVWVEKPIKKHLDVVAFTNNWEDWPGPKGGPSFYLFVATSFGVHQLSRPSVASPSSLAAVSCFSFCMYNGEYNEGRHVLLRVRSLLVVRVSFARAVEPRPYCRGGLRTVRRAPGAR